MKAKTRNTRSSGELFFCYRCRRFKRKPPAFTYGDQSLCNDCMKEGKSL